jgi:DNA-directed RNA polymerase subunit RPC12/RpoP
MARMITIKLHCNDCSMEFELKYDDDKYICPSHCVACGSDNDLVEVE